MSIFETIWLFQTNQIGSDHKTSLLEIKELKKQILELTEHSKTPHKLLNGEQKIKRLQKELVEKDEELAKLELKITCLTDSNELLDKKLIYSEKQMKTLKDKIVDFHENFEKINIELDERRKMVDYLSGTNKELEDFIKDMRYQHNKSGSGLDSSFDFLNQSLCNQGANSSKLMEKTNLNN